MKVRESSLYFALAAFLIVGMIFGIFYATQLSDSLFRSDQEELIEKQKVYYSFPEDACTLYRYGERKPAEYICEVSQ